MRLDAVERACYNPPAQKTEYCGVEQWQLVGLITQRSLVRIQAPLLRKTVIYMITVFVLTFTGYTLLHFVEFMIFSRMQVRISCC